MRRLGQSELVVGRLAYGCWRFDGTDVPAAQAKIEAALHAGLTLVDTADVYGHEFGGAEALLGAVLAGAPHLRERMVLATKGGIRRGVPYDSSAAWLRRACDDSLRRLGVDVIDLYQVHRPDLLAHPAEVAAVLAELRAAGKVREVGVSNYTPAQVSALRAHLDVPLVTQQPEYSALHLAALDDGVLDQCMELDLTPLAWSPLAGGRLATADPFDPLSRVLDELAEREGSTRDAVALAFVLAHPSQPVAIVGTQQTERIRAAADALAVHLDRADCYRIIAAAGRELP